MELDLAKKLENCPKGFSLYSPLLGVVTLREANPMNDFKTIVVEDQEENAYNFDRNGRLCGFSNSECMLYPHKDNRNWEDFKFPSESISKRIDAIEAQLGDIIARVSAINTDVKVNFPTGYVIFKGRREE